MQVHLSSGLFRRQPGTLPQRPPAPLRNADPPRPPAASTARAASVSDAPVVIRSSTSTTRSAASSRPPPATTSSAPARFASRCRAPSPAWSATGAPLPQHRHHPGRHPAAPQLPAAASAIRRAGSCPRAGHRPPRRRHGHQQQRPRAAHLPRPGPHGPGQRRCRAARPERSAPAPCAPGAPPVPRPRTRAAACTTGSPAGSGAGRTRRGAAPYSAARQPSHSSVRGLPQPHSRPAAPAGDLPPPPPHISTVPPAHDPATPVENPALARDPLGTARTTASGCRRRITAGDVRRIDRTPRTGLSPDRPATSPS